MTGPDPGLRGARIGVAGEPEGASISAPSLRLGRRVRRLFTYPTTGPLGALIVIFIVFSVGTSTFLNAGNMSLIAQQSVVIGTLALGQTLIILVSGIDLADGAIMVLGTVVAGSYASHASPLMAMALGLLACVLTAAANGVVIAWFRLPPFIATLGMYTVIAAGARVYTDSRSFPINFRPPRRAWVRTRCQRLHRDLWNDVVGRAHACLGLRA